MLGNCVVARSPAYYWTDFRLKSLGLCLAQIPYSRSLFFGGISSWLGFFPVAAALLGDAGDYSVAALPDRITV
jgi:hypothetical protein